MEIIQSLPLWLQSGLYGMLSGSALLIGALIGFYIKVPLKVIAYVMAFGSGVLISALAFDLMDEAYDKGGFQSTALGFVGGAIMYSSVNYLLNKKGAQHRKRSGFQQQKKGAAGLAIAIGALLDGIPESIAIGASMISGGAVSVAAVAAVFMSNLPEGLSSSMGMKNAGRSSKYIFGIWIFIAVLSSIASIIGYVVFKDLSPIVVSATIAMAAGGVLAMLSETMMPEAYEEGHEYIGVVTVLGFLAAFILTNI